MQATVLILDIPDDSSQVFLVCVCGYDKDCGDHYERAYRGSKKWFFRSVCRLVERGQERKQETTGKKKTFAAARV